MMIRFKLSHHLSNLSFHISRTSKPRYYSLFRNSNNIKYNSLIKGHQQKLIIARWFSNQEKDSILSREEQKEEVDDIEKNAKEALNSLRGFLYRATTFRFLIDSLILSPYIVYRIANNTISTILFILDEITSRLRIVYATKNLKDITKRKLEESNSIKLSLARFVNRVKQNPLAILSLFFRITIYLPFKYTFKMIKYALIFVLYSIFSPLLLLRGIGRSISKLMFKKKDESTREILWKALAPIPWQLYAEGEKLGLLNSKSKPIYKRVIKHRKIARDRLFRRKEKDSNNKNESL